ncbi:hypothetical protein Tco_0586374 [Tanacetum coccineum]
MFRTHLLILVEPKNIKEAMADSEWIEAMQNFINLIDYKSGNSLTNPLARMKRVIDIENHSAPVALYWSLSGFLSLISCTQVHFSKLSDDVKMRHYLKGLIEEEFMLHNQTDSYDLIIP